MRQGTSAPKTRAVNDFSADHGQEHLDVGEVLLRGSQVVLVQDQEIRPFPRLQGAEDVFPQDGLSPPSRRHEESSLAVNRLICAQTGGLFGSRAPRDP